MNSASSPEQQSFLWKKTTNLTTSFSSTPPTPNPNDCNVAGGYEGDVSDTNSAPALLLKETTNLTIGIKDKSRLSPRFREDEKENSPRDMVFDNEQKLTADLREQQVKDNIQRLNSKKVPFKDGIAVLDQKVGDSFMGTRNVSSFPTQDHTCTVNEQVDLSAKNPREKKENNMSENDIPFTMKRIDMGPHFRPESKQNLPHAKDSRSSTSPELSLGGGMTSGAQEIKESPTDYISKKSGRSSSQRSGYRHAQEDEKEQKSNSQNLNQIDEVRYDQKGRPQKTNQDYEMVCLYSGKPPIAVSDSPLSSSDPLSDSVEVKDNKFNFCRDLHNVGNVTLRQILAVGIPTYLRQPIAMLIQYGMINSSPAEHRVLAWTAVLYPIALNAAGAWFDRSAADHMEAVVGDHLNRIKDIRGIEIKGTITEDDRKELVALFRNDNKHVSDGFEQIAKLYVTNYDAHREQINEVLKALKEKIDDEYWHTTSSEICRGLMGVGVMATAIAADLKGLLGELAPTLVAFIVYCQLREVAQSFLALNDGVKKFYLRTAVYGGFAYLANQLCVGFLTNYYASPSGQSAANVTFAANGTYADVVGNDFTRAALNTVGEIVDLLMLTSMQCWAMKKDLTLTLEINKLSIHKIKKILTGIHTARVNLFVFNVILAAIVAHMIDLNPIAGAFVGAVLSALTDAVTLGTCYSIFLGLADRANWTEDSSIQSGGQALR